MTADEARTGRGAVPVFQEFMNPVLAVLRSAQAPVPNAALETLVIERMGLAPEVVAALHNPEKGGISEAGYRIAWAKTYLKRANLIDNPSLGSWALTPEGLATTQVEPYKLAGDVARKARDLSQSKREGDELSVPLEETPLETVRLESEIERRLRERHQELSTAGELVRPEAAARAYALFRETFGPDVLAGLDGERLLEKLHARGNKDSLVYWLEFKADDELPVYFGGIAGGSALKFGLYWSSDSKQWMSGNWRKQLRLSTDEAVARARKQRDQFVAGAEVLSRLPHDPSAIEPASLQAAMMRAAPDVANTAWGHKYFALLAPNLIGTFHSDAHQAFQLIKLLQQPGDGRYANDITFAVVAKQLGWPLLDLMQTIFRQNGEPHQYWRLGTTSSEGSEWPRMRDGGFASVGWRSLGDLSDVPDDVDARRTLRERIERFLPEDPGTMTKGANQLSQFLFGAPKGDVVVAMEGARVHGVGRLAGDYVYQAADGPFPHRRAVEWLDVGDWQLPELEGLRTTFVSLKKATNLIAIESRLLHVVAAPSRPVSVRPQAPVLGPLPAVIARIDTVLQRKRQVILFGPPGTGKTFWAERAADEFVARSWYGLEPAQLSPVQRGEMQAARCIEFCSFHPAFGYEDFLEGFRPIKTDGGLAFEVREGVFKALCARASSAPGRPYVLIIDEINRGDIPRIFGELLTVLERDKRGRKITLPISGDAFSVPDNVYVIGTMNTADRSIAMLDAALRRRFGFVELLPDSSALGGVSIAGLPLAAWFDELNVRITKHVGRDARHLQVGHSYFMTAGAPIRDLGRFVEIFRDDVVPLLEEYCYEDSGMLEKLLGPKIAGRDAQRVDARLFEPDRQTELIQALLSSYSNITATQKAVDADAPAEPESDAATDE